MILVVTAAKEGFSHGPAMGLGFWLDCWAGGTGRGALLPPCLALSVVAVKPCWAG